MRRGSAALAKAKRLRAEMEAERTTTTAHQALTDACSQS